MACTSYSWYVILNIPQLPEFLLKRKLCHILKLYSLLYFSYVVWFSWFQQLVNYIWIWKHSKVSLATANGSNMIDRYTATSFALSTIVLTCKCNFFLHLTMVLPVIGIVFIITNSLSLSGSFSCLKAVKLIVKVNGCLGF